MSKEQPEEPAIGPTEYAIYTDGQYNEKYYTAIERLDHIFNQDLVIHRAATDKNSLWRALSIGVYASEERWTDVRSKTCSHLRKFKDEFAKRYQLESEAFDEMVDDYETSKRIGFRVIRAFAGCFKVNLCVRR